MPKKSDYQLAKEFFFHNKITTEVLNGNSKKNHLIKIAQKGFKDLEMDFSSDDGHLVAWSPSLNPAVILLGK